MDPMTSFVSAMMAAQAMSSCFTESPSSDKAGRYIGMVSEL